MNDDSDLILVEGGIRPDLVMTEAMYELWSQEWAKAAIDRLVFGMGAVKQNADGTIEHLPVRSLGKDPEESSS